MQFTTHNNATIDTNGCSRQGEITANYDELCKLFGEPTDGDGYKVDAHWGIRFEDGTIATVYNYKSGKNYNGRSGTPTEQITYWHIGGFSKAAADNVQITLDLWRESQPKSAFDEAFEDVDTMYRTIASKHGDGYARTVEMAVLAKKLLDLNGVLLSALVDTNAMEDKKAEVIFGLAGTLVSKIISKTSDALKVKIKGPADAEALMQWADRITECESKGAMSLVKQGATKQ
jgi:hypothetical protein